MVTHFLGSSNALYWDFSFVRAGLDAEALRAMSRRGDIASLEAAVTLGDALCAAHLGTDLGAQVASIGFCELHCIQRAS